jgi:ABC-type lipoprotein release transport system permease subunit
VRQVLPRVAFSGLISNGDKSVVMVATGIEPDAEFAVKGPFLKIGAGKVLASGQQGAQVMLGEGLARSLKAGPGSSLTLLASTTEGALNALDVVVAVFSTGVPDRQAAGLHRHGHRAEAAGDTACPAWACSSPAWTPPRRPGPRCKPRGRS